MIFFIEKNKKNDEIKKIKLNKIGKFKLINVNLSSYNLPIANKAQDDNINIQENNSLNFMSQILTIRISCKQNAY